MFDGEVHTVFETQQDHLQYKGSVQIAFHLNGVTAIALRSFACAGASSPQAQPAEGLARRTEVDVLHTFFWQSGAE